MRDPIEVSLKSRSIQRLSIFDNGLYTSLKYTKQNGEYITSSLSAVGAAILVEVCEHEAHHNKSVINESSTEDPIA